MYAIHDGDEMLHGVWLSYGHLILVVVIRSGQGIGGTLMGKQKEFPHDTEGDPGRWVHYARQSDALVLRPGFDSCALSRYFF
jgi:hypothetical protein